MRPANGPSDKHCRKALPWQRYSRCACTTWRHTSALTTRIGGAPAPSWRHSDGNFAPLTRGKCTPSFAHSWRKRKSGSWTEPIPLWEASSNAGFCRTILPGWSRQARQTGLLGMYASSTTHCPTTPPATSGACLADHLVMHLVGQTNGLLHFASLYALLPLLDDEGIFRFQQWHQGFLDSQDMPEPASGSGSRDPR